MYMYMLGSTIGALFKHFGVTVVVIRLLENGVCF